MRVCIIIHQRIADDYCSFALGSDRRRGSPETFGTDGHGRTTSAKLQLNVKKTSIFHKLLDNTYSLIQFFRKELLIFPMTLS